jgi:vacuolar-type H+-ATPase subunit I/STV1
MRNKETPNKKIRELEKKLKRLEAEKEILNRAIDIADEQLGTDIRKKYYVLLSEVSKQQGTDDTVSH